MVLDLLPVGVAVIDVYGILRFANARMLAMTGFTRDDVVGRSVLDFVASEEFSNATDILTAGRGFIGRTMGPIRLRYRGADGQLRATEMWAQNCLDVAGIDGYVATFAEESVNDHMSRAFASISSGAPLEQTLQVVIDSMAVHPMEATAVVALQGPDGLSLVGDWPLTGYEFTIDDPLAPWTFTLKRGQAARFSRSVRPSGRVAQRGHQCRFPVRVGPPDRLATRPARRADRVASPRRPDQPEPGAADGGRRGALRSGVRPFRDPRRRCWSTPAS